MEPFFIFAIVGEQSIPSFYMPLKRLLIPSNIDVVQCVSPSSPSSVIAKETEHTRTNEIFRLGDPSSCNAPRELVPFFPCSASRISLRFADRGYSIMKPTEERLVLGTPLIAKGMATCPLCLCASVPLKNFLRRSFVL